MFFTLQQLENEIEKEVLKRGTSGDETAYIEFNVDEVDAETLDSLDSTCIYEYFENEFSQKKILIIYCENGHL